MPRRQDEDNAISIVFLIALVVGTWFWGWIGAILSVVLLFAMLFNSSPYDSKEQTKKSSKTKSKQSKSLFDMIEEDKKKEEEKKKQKLEKEMDIYGLSEDEKEIVRNSNGEYEPYQFDEEDLEEDD